MGAGGHHEGLQLLLNQPLGQPLQLAVAEEAVAVYVAAGKQNQDEPAMSPARREGWKAHSPVMLDTFLPPSQHGWKGKYCRVVLEARTMLNNLNSISSPHRATHSCTPVTLPTALNLLTNFQSNPQEQTSNATPGLTEGNRGGSATAETRSAARPAPTSPV